MAPIKRIVSRFRYQNAARFYKSRVAPKQNQIETKMLECLDKDHKAWLACRSAAECRGISAETCGIDPVAAFE